MNECFMQTVQTSLTFSVRVLHFQYYMYIGLLVGAEPMWLNFQPFSGHINPYNKGPPLNIMMIGTVTFAGCTVTFGRAKRVLGRLWAPSQIGATDFHGPQNFEPSRGICCFVTEMS